MAGGDLAELRALVTADTAGFMRGMDSVDRRMGKTQQSMARVGAAAGTMGRVAKVGALALGGGMLLGAGYIAKAGFSMAMLKQNAQIAFTTMLGSGQKATRMMNDLQKFAATTPFEFKELIPASQRLLAMGFAAKDVIPMLTDVGDAAAGLGLGSEGVNRITLALGQMQAKGKVAGGEMMQLTEAGIPAWKYLAEATGKSTAEVMKMSEKGLLPADMAIKAIRDGMRGDFGGMMAKQSKTLSGQLSNLADQFNNVAGNIVGKFVPGLSKAATKLNDWLSSKSGQDFLQSIIDGAGAAASAIGTAVGFIVKHWGQIRAVAGTVATAVIGGVKAMAGVIGPLLGAAIEGIQAHWDQIKQGAETAFQGAMAAATAVAGYVTGTLVPGLKEIGNALAPAVPPLQAFAAVLVTNVIPAATTFFGFLQAHQGTVEALAGAALAIAAAMAVYSAATTVATIVTTGYAAAMTALDAAFAISPFGLVALAVIGLVTAIVILWKRNEAFRGAVIGAWNAIKSSVGGAIGAVRGAISSLAGAFNSVKGAVSSAVGAIVSVVSSLGGKVLSAIKTAFQIAWNPGPTLKKVGQAAVNGIVSGLSSLASKAWGAIKTALSGISGAIHFGVHFTFGSQTFGLGPLPDITVPYPNGISFGANGGTFGGGRGLGLIGEAGREFAIPVTRNRGGALKLWAQAGRELGVPMMANGGVAGSPPSDPGVRNPFAPGAWSRGRSLSSLYQLESDYEANTRRWQSFYGRSGGGIDANENRALAGRIGVTQAMLKEIGRVRGVDSRRLSAAKRVLRRRQATLRAAQKAAGRKGLSKSAQKAADARVRRAQSGVNSAQKRVDFWSGQLGSGANAHDLAQQGYDLEQDRQGFLSDAIPPPPPPADTGGGGADTGTSGGIDAGAGVSAGSGGSSGGLSGGGGSGGPGVTYITIDMRGAVVTVDDFVAQVREKLAAYGKVNGSIFGNVQADTVPR